MRLTFALMLLILAAPSFGADKSSADAIEKLQGCYIEKVFTSDVTDHNEKLVPVYNTLKISKTSEGQWQFEAFVAGGNFHQCSASGTLKPGEKNTLAVIPDENVTKELGNLYKCQLQIQISKSSLRLYEPEGSECHALFLCGARASLNGQVFRRARKVPLNDKRCNP